MRSPCQEQTGISGGDGGQAHFSFILGNASCAHFLPRWTDPVEVVVRRIFLSFWATRAAHSPCQEHAIRSGDERAGGSEDQARHFSSVSGMSCAHFVSRWTDPAVVSKPVEARHFSSVSGMSCAHFVSRWTDPVTAREPVEVVIRRVIFLPFPA